MGSAKKNSKKKRIVELFCGFSSPKNIPFIDLFPPKTNDKVCCEKIFPPPEQQDFSVLAKATTQQGDHMYDNDDNDVGGYNYGQHYHC